MRLLAVVSCRVCGGSMAGRHHAARHCSDDCKREAQRRHRRSWGSRNKEQIAESGRRYAAANPERYAEYAYKKRYGLTYAEVEAMWEAQGRKCACCQESVRLVGAKGRDKAVVDHCHRTGRVRGLLCTPCNLMIGYAKDSASLLAAAIQYLEAQP